MASEFRENSTALPAMTVAENELIEENRNVIREYLKSQFPGSSIIETFDRPHYHNFIVTMRMQYQCYKLQVLWPRLSRHSNTPDKTQSALDKDDVAGKMIRAADYFVW